MDTTASSDCCGVPAGLQEPRVKTATLFPLERCQLSEPVTIFSDVSGGSTGRENRDVLPGVKSPRPPSHHARAESAPASLNVFELSLALVQATRDPRESPGKTPRRRGPEKGCHGVPGGRQRGARASKESGIPKFQGQQQRRLSTPRASNTELRTSGSADGGQCASCEVPRGTLTAEKAGPATACSPGALAESLEKAPVADSDAGTFTPQQQIGPRAPALQTAGTGPCYAVEGDRTCSPGTDAELVEMTGSEAERGEEGLEQAAVDSQAPAGVEDSGDSYKKLPAIQRRQSRSPGSGFPGVRSGAGRHEEGDGCQGVPGVRRQARWFGSRVEGDCVEEESWRCTSEEVIGVPERASKGTSRDGIAGVKSSSCELPALQHIPCDSSAMGRAGGLAEDVLIGHTKGGRREETFAEQSLVLTGQRLNSDSKLSVIAKEPRSRTASLGAILAEEIGRGGQGGQLVMLPRSQSARSSSTTKPMRALRLSLPKQLGSGDCAPLSSRDGNRSVKGAIRPLLNIEELWEKEVQKELQMEARWDFAAWKNPSEIL